MSSFNIHASHFSFHYIFANYYQPNGAHSKYDGSDDDDDSDSSNDDQGSGNGPFINGHLDSSSVNSSLLNHVH